MNRDDFTTEERALWQATFAACIGGFCSNQNSVLQAALTTGGIAEDYRGLKIPFREKIVTGARFMADDAVAEFRRCFPTADKSPDQSPPESEFSASAAAGE